MTPKFSPAARTKARERVLQALYQWHLAGHDIPIIEEYFMQEQDMRKVDIAYFELLLHQIPSHLNELHSQLLPFLDRDFNQLDPIERAILYIGGYELRYCQDVPFRVVLNEGIELAKKFGATESYKFVNGVLDKYARHLHPQSQTAKKAILRS
jgi:transcription antitermination protein NusB